MIKGSYNLGKVAGIPIRVHITLVILLLFVLLKYELIGLLIAAGVCTSIVLHELGHSLVAMRKGTYVHEIILMPIGGMAKMANMPQSPWDEVTMALAGPGVSVSLAFISYAMGYTLNLGGLVLIPYFLYTLAAVNLMLGIFNLLPAFPMDGGRVLRAVLTPRLGRLKATGIAAKCGQVLAVLLGCIGLFWPGHIHIMLILIAVFIYRSAGTEYKFEMRKNGFENIFGRPSSFSREEDTGGFQVHVTPPPYAENEKKETFIARLRDNLKKFFQA